MEPVYRVVIAAVTLAFRLFGWRIDVRGLEHLPPTGPAIVATNHIGYLDFTFVGYGVHKHRRVLRFLAKKEIFDKPVVGWLMRGMRHIEVDRYGKAVDSYRKAIDALRHGEMIGMFPEATISTSFVPMAGKTGAARMAMAAGAPLIPGVVWGSQRLVTKGRPRNLQRGVAITVAYGPAIPYEPGDDPAAVTRQLMARITELLESVQTHYPQRPARPDDRWWLPAHLGGTAPSVAEAKAALAKEAADRRALRRRVRRAEGDRP